MQIKKLLFVTKFDELSFDALRSLLSLRQAHLNHVVFVTVIERDKVAMYRGVGYKKDLEIRLKERANIRFIDWASTLFEEGMEVGAYIVVGNLVSQVMESLEKEEGDLIVIGRPHDKGVLQHLYSGSDVTELLHRSTVPILVFKHMQEGTNVPRDPFERPLLAVDWSPASLRGIEYLKSLKGLVTEVDVMTVASMTDLTGSSAMSVQKLRKDTRHRLDEVCDRLEAEGIAARSHVYIGDPVEEIERAARECRTSVIVVGSSSKSVWTERWLGSIPRTLAAKSGFSVLVVPPEKR